MRLAIDTTSDRLSVAARAPDGRTAVRTLAGARQHARALAPLTVEALAEVGGDVAALRGIALSDGPGSFTGLRVAVAFAKALARAGGVPVRTASTLLVRAWAARSGGPPGEIVAGVGSALRGELYVAVYRFGAPDRPEVIVAPTVLPSGAALPGGVMPAVVAGDVDPALLERWPWAAGARRVGPPAGLPSATALCELAEAGIAPVVQALDDWEPFYGRPAEAQAKWERVHGRPLGDPAGGR
jgi:tRNA threonylcarbamoyladenosine biosynthesis protein TsaB